MSTPLRMVRNCASNLTQIFKTVLQVGCISHCFLKYVADFAVCYGPSMEPTITSYDILVCEHISARLLRFNYGDIVISKSPTQPELYVCKRITGLPGDRISHRNHKIVPAGHVWLEGDNRDRSLDSNEYGPVPQGLIQGRVICRIWPLSDKSDPWNSSTYTPDNGMRIQVASHTPPICLVLHETGSEFVHKRCLRT